MAEANLSPEDCASAPSSEPGGELTCLVNAIDQLDCEIRFAHGLFVAIDGLRCECEPDHIGVKELAHAHITRLQSICDGLEQLNRGHDLAPLEAVAGASA